MVNVEIFLEDSGHWTSKIIRLGMFLFQVFRIKKPRRAYTHGGIRIGYTIYEATEKGVVKKQRELKSRHKIWHVPVEQKAIDYLKFQVGKTYEFANFFYHAWRIINSKAYKGSQTDEQFSCVELVCWLLIKSGYQLDFYLNPIELENYLDKNFLNEMD